MNVSRRRSDSPLRAARRVYYMTRKANVDARDQAVVFAGQLESGMRYASHRPGWAAAHRAHPSAWPAMEGRAVIKRCLIKMKHRILGLLAVGLLAGPMAANAALITFDLTYSGAHSGKRRRVREHHIR